MSTDLDVCTFSNGDSLMLCNNQEQWLYAIEKRIPAYCYYEFINQYKFYNYWAISDSRSIAPLGWHIATHEEWEIMLEFYNIRSSVGDKNSKPYHLTESQMYYTIEDNLIEFVSDGVGWYWQDDGVHYQRYISEIGCPPSIDYIIDFCQGALIRCVKDY